MDELKKRIIVHLDTGKEMEIICKRNNFGMPNHDYLEGFRQGLRLVLSMISNIEEEIK